MAVAVAVFADTAVAAAPVPFVTWPRYVAFVAPLTVASGIFTSIAPSPTVAPSVLAVAVLAESLVTVNAPVVDAVPPSPPAIVSAETRAIDEVPVSRQPADPVERRVGVRPP